MLVIEPWAQVFGKLFWLPRVCSLPQRQAPCKGCRLQKSNSPLEVAILKTGIPQGEWALVFFLQISRLVNVLKQTQGANQSCSYKVGKKVRGYQAYMNQDGGSPMPPLFASTAKSTAFIIC